MNKYVLSLLLVVLSLCIITIGSQQSLLTTLQMQRHLRENKQAYQDLVLRSIVTEKNQHNTNFLNICAEFT